MLLPAAKGLVPANAVNAPPSKLPDTLAEGMLSPAPSASAEPGLAKNAYSVTWPNRIGRTQLVVMLTGTLPFATPLGGRLKFTKPGAAVTVIELFSAALSDTVAVFEFNCANIHEGNKLRSATKKAMPTRRFPPGFALRSSLARYELKPLSFVLRVRHFPWMRKPIFTASIHR